MRAVASAILKHYGTREAYGDAMAESGAGGATTDSREEPIGITSTVYEHLEALAAGLERSPGEVASAILSRHCTIDAYETAVRTAGADWLI